MADILMPKATAVWLIDNTILGFEQIADFCGLHPLEVKGIADGDVAENMRGADPVSGGSLTREEIRKAEQNPAYRMKLADSRIAHIPQPKRKGARYTPIARRGDKPDAIAWFIRHHPEVGDSQICKLIGTTRTTIGNVRDRTHWNAAEIKPVDPVTLGLCSQIELDAVIAGAAARRRAMDATKTEQDKGAGLVATETVEQTVHTGDKVDTQPEISADEVFRAFKK